MNAREEIRAMFDLVPRQAGWKHPEFVIAGRREYRGKMRWVAGYSRSRLHAHHASGRVYDRILGWGDTQEEAIAMMRRKLKPREAV